MISQYEAELKFIENRKLLKKGKGTVKRAGTGKSKKNPVKCLCLLVYLLVETE